MKSGEDRVEGGEGTPLADLRHMLSRLHRNAGEPSTREISRMLDRAISHTTIGIVLRCERLPKWGQLELVVDSLGGDVARFRSLWIATRDFEDRVAQQSQALTRVDDNPYAARGYIDPRRWRSCLRDGSLEVTHWGGMDRDAYVLIDTTSAVLAEKNFRADTIRRFAVCFVELLTNVARHTSGRAIISIAIDATHFRAVRMVFGDAGAGFNLAQIIRLHTGTIESGGREHGLMKVSRLADSLHRIDEHSRHETACEIYDFELPETPFFSSGMILPIRLDFLQISYRVWLNQSCYGERIYYHLEYPAVADLYFQDLQYEKHELIGIEFAGAGYQHSLLSGEDPVDDLLQAIARSFPRNFAEGRVLVDATEATWRLRDKAEEWSHARGFNLYTSEAAVRDRIARL